MSDKTKKTPLYEQHLKLNALMAEFAGWDMPIHYGSIIEETKHTRLSVSIFDISHMGELIVKEDPEKSSLERLITVPVTKMEIKSCRYGFLLNRDGACIDDLIVYRVQPDQWMIVVNASNEERDAAIISEGLSAGSGFENISERTVKIDIQGPGALKVVQKIIGSSAGSLEYYHFDVYDFYGGRNIASRTGYTGELGFEIYIDVKNGKKLWDDLLGIEGVKPAGLGSRDILRTEMGYPLYGHELSEEIGPVEAGMSRFLDMEKDFTGKEVLLEKMDKARINLAGFVSEGRRTPRNGNVILIDDEKVGNITSGVFSPHLNKGIALGYIDSAYARIGQEVFIDTGRGNIGSKITGVPFISGTSLKS